MMRLSLYSLEFPRRNYETNLLKLFELPFLCPPVCFVLFSSFFSFLFASADFFSSYNTCECDVAPSGMFATASIDKTVKVWDVANVHNNQQGDNDGSKSKKKV